MTTKTEEQDRADFEAWYQHHHGDRDVYVLDESGEYADKQVQGAFNVWQAAIAHDRQDHLRTAAKMMPSDAEILACLRPLYSNDVAAAMGAEDDLRTAHLLLSHFGSGQPAASAEPAVWVAADTLNSPHPKCISSLAYMSQIDQDRGREYVPLAIINHHAAPAAAPLAAQASAQDREDDEALADTQRQIIEAAEQRGYARAMAECAQDLEDAGDPLQGAANWLVGAIVNCSLGDLQRRLLIGHNRAGRLLDAARAAKEQP